MREQEQHAGGAERDEKGHEGTEREMMPAGIRSVGGLLRGGQGTGHTATLVVDGLSEPMAAPVECDTGEDGTRQDPGGERGGDSDLDGLAP